MQIKKSLLYVVGVFIAFLFAIQVHAENAVITADEVNIRSGPGTEYEPIGQANSDEKYPIINKQNEWIEIGLKNGTGWIIEDYVVIQNESHEIRKPINGTIIIQNDNTHLRSGPSTDYDIIAFVNKGEEFDVISETEQWYEVTNETHTGFIFKELLTDQNEMNSDFNNKTIVIDAGHGGHDVGAIGATGTFEKNFTYLTAMELEKELSSFGAKVLLTRPEDEFISLESRASYSNIMDTDAFISIHYNSFPEQTDVTGIETYYFHEQNKELANFIQQEIIKGTNTRDRGASFGDYYVIRQNFKPGVLIELDFISNQEVEQLLQTNSYQKRLVSGIVSGLGKYFSRED